MKKNIKWLHQMLEEQKMSNNRILKIINNHKKIPNKYHKKYNKNINNKMLNK